MELYQQFCWQYWSDILLPEEINEGPVAFPRGRAFASLCHDDATTRSNASLLIATHAARRHSRQRQHYACCPVGTLCRCQSFLMTGVYYDIPERCDRERCPGSSHR